MKHLSGYIVCLFLLFNAAVCRGAEVNLPPDFRGEATMRLAESINEGESGETDTEQTLQIMSEIGAYFYNKYSAEDIAKDSFIEELRPFFPQDSDGQLKQKLSYLRAITEIYAKAKNLYGKYIKELMIPRIYRKVRSSDDYDHPDEIKYIESEPGYFTKVYNFKKFLTYSKNEDERQAIEDFKQRDKKQSLGSKIIRMIKTAEWKKMFFYGTVYKNPLASEEGISETQSAPDVKAALLSKNSYIRGNKELYFGVMFETSPFAFVVANNIGKDITKPLIDFSGSKNVEKSEIMYPVPLNSAGLPSVHKYFGEFMIPVKITLKNPDNPLTVRAKVSLTTCDRYMNCSPAVFNFKLTLQTNGDELLSNGYTNFFDVTLSHMPQKDGKNLALKTFVVDTDRNGKQILRLEFESRKKAESFKIFAEAKDRIILFDAPRISLQDHKIYVRLIPLDEHGTTDMADETFVLSAVLNGEYYYRAEKQAGFTSEFDTGAASLSLGLFLLAVIGGFILNFMPCVFPVLSMKIMLLAKAGSEKRKKIRADLLQTAGGIFCGFTLLVIMLWTAKFAGRSLGWGMQFQSLGFLVSMTLAVTAVAVLLPSFNLEKIIQPHGKYAGFVTGNLAVLMATPCTGPYLATAVGFALAGSYTDIAVIMYGVALGLSAPYLLISALKDPENFFPKPGPWMQKLEIVMRVMLYLTVLWFLLLLYGQTDAAFICKFSVLLMLFAATVLFYKKFSAYLDGVPDEKVPAAMMKKIRRMCAMFLLAVSVLCALAGTVTAGRSFAENYKNNMKERLTYLNKDLINDYLDKGHPVLVEISADWCLTCHVNKFLVFGAENLKHWKKTYNLEFIRVDWTDYNKEILDYMGQYGRKGLPFYVLYTPFVREGVVLPEIFDEGYLTRILRASDAR